MKQKINYIQIIFHFVATYFIMFSFKTFSWLNYIKVIEAAAIHGPKYVMENLEKLQITTVEIAYFNFWPNIISLVGIVFSFIISITISKIKKWSILNSFIVLIIIYLLYRYNTLGWNYFKILAIGSFIDDYHLNFIITGSFFLIIGLVIFFSKWTNRIIEKRQIELKTQEN
ncbi:hypothetical protein HNP37_003131 [Flavobacterium nitrogenifigens]|uniref:Uncharacterized protein n=2 Tax=Flavobacterium TaxID=237 RepID=A0A7W7N930_9FLAO|nr:MULTISPECIES: hypothetical protein [Flavobacterium]MBB4803056.1 hypothetical protein [Flavobacterium nitrogenifigens]MBB6388014.1 hypothetical protein [Flavobacterium notoginsengisoli]